MSLDALANLNIGSLVGKPSRSQNTKDQLHVDLALIEEDPLNVRLVFDEDKLQALADTIRENGVLTPISIRPNPDKSGHFIINNGARRFRASTLLGLKSIPAFIDEQHDEINQMIDNLEREDLTPLEIAQKIYKLANNDDKTKRLKKEDIAKRLGAKPAWISKHLKLLEIPEKLKFLYDMNRCNDLEALYAITSAYKKYPHQIDKWLDTFKDSSDIITQQAANAFLNKLKEKDKPKAVSPIAEQGEASVDRASQPDDTDYEADEAGRNFDSNDNAGTKTPTTGQQSSNESLQAGHDLKFISISMVGSDEQHQQITQQLQEFLKQIQQHYPTAQLELQS